MVVFSAHTFNMLNEVSPLICLSNRILYNMSDEISNSLIKVIKEYLIIHKTLTVNQSLMTGIIPQKLNIVKV